MSKDNYFEQLEKCQKTYNAAWETHTDESAGNFYPGQHEDITCVPFGL